MTVVLVTARRVYVGLSGDTKPSGPPAGSTFFETDTRRTYLFDGSAWQANLREIA